MTLRKFFRDYGGHGIGLLGVLIAILSLLYSHRAVTLAERQAEITMAVPLPLTIEENCTSRIDTWPEWAVLQRLVISTGADDEDSPIEVRQRSDEIDLALAASRHAQAWIGYFVPSHDTSNARWFEMPCPWGGEGCTPTAQVTQSNLPLLATYDVEVGGETRTTYKLLLLRVKYWYYPTGANSISETPYFTCDSIVPIRTANTEAQANELLTRARAELDRYRQRVVVDGVIPAPSR